MDNEFTITHILDEYKQIKHVMQNISVQNYSLKNTSLLNKFSWHSLCSGKLHQWHCGTLAAQLPAAYLTLHSVLILRKISRKRLSQFLQVYFSWSSVTNSGG